MAEPVWCCSVMVEAANLNDCIPHPYWMYKQSFSSLRCCGWAYAYGCTLTLLHPYGWGWILGKLGMAKSEWCCGVMVEAPNPQRLHPPFSTLRCCGWACEYTLMPYYMCWWGRILGKMGYGRAWMMLRCQVEVANPQRLHPTFILDVYKVL